MLKIFSILVFVLMALLLIPTGLVLASQDAIPGDLTYPLKRQLENITIRLASSNPETAAYFKADLSKRRFAEATALLSKGKNANETLVELIAQTKQAAYEIDQIKDESSKQKLVANLSQKIADYNQSLTKIEESNKADIATSPQTALPPTPAAVLTSPQPISNQTPPPTTSPLPQPSIASKPLEPNPEETTASGPKPSFSPDKGPLNPPGSPVRKTPNPPPTPPSTRPPETRPQPPSTTTITQLQTTLRELQKIQNELAKNNPNMHLENRKSGSNDEEGNHDPKPKPSETTDSKGIPNVKPNRLPSQHN